MQYFMKYLFVFIVLSVILSGCHRENHLGTAIVKGNVKVDGQPAEGIDVIFVPVSADGLAAYGQTDVNGDYLLTTAGTNIGDGAVPGEFIPTFTKVSLEYDQRFVGRLDVVPPPPKVTHLIPEKYSLKEKTDIPHVTVVRGKKNSFDFELSSK
ncbi:MAG: hypothetical protein LBJ67_06605 [Planctomycetaceae bacterium]|jgi:hypothetical protein|nr:hypothetical protein [Planctomycetaceae bacterium]